MTGESLFGDMLKNAAESVRRAEDPDVDTSTLDGLKDLIVRQADLLTTVATSSGQPDWRLKNPAYIRRRRDLNAAASSVGLPRPYPFADLADWHGRWSQLETWRERRLLVAGLRDAALARVDRLAQGSAVHDPGPPAGAADWDDLGIRLDGMADRLAAADSQDDLQDVGRRAREILKDLAGRLADPSLVRPGADLPRAGDAKAWLALYLERNAAGPAHAELRAVVRTVWDLANKVTHSDAITRADSYAAAQSTNMLVRVLQALDADARD